MLDEEEDLGTLSSVQSFPMCLTLQGPCFLDQDVLMNTRKGLGFKKGRIALPSTDGELDESTEEEVVISDNGIMLDA